MLKNSAAGLYPTIVLHRSHVGKLAIGGAMLTKLDYTEEYAAQATPSSGGWSTRFDGGTLYNRHLDLPCNYVAMYVEGLIHIRGYEGAYDSETEIYPSCFAVVAFRFTEKTEEQVILGGVYTKTGQRIKTQHVYLQSSFGFTDRIRHDGLYDLKNAFEIARWNGGRNLEQLDEDPLHRGRREWHLVSKAGVPGRIRQVLHRSLKHVDAVVTKGFGQGIELFKIPGRRR